MRTERYQEQILLTVEDPDLLYAGYYGDLKAARRFRDHFTGGKFVMVVCREVRSRDGLKKKPEPRG